MHAALIKRRAANLAPAASRAFSGYAEGVTKVPNAGLAPDGTNTAMLLRQNSNDSWHYTIIYLPGAISQAKNQNLTFSVHLKAAGHEWVRFNAEHSWVGHAVDLNPQTGELRLPPPGHPWRPLTYRAETLPNGWYRLSITVNNRNPDTGIVVAIALVHGGNFNYSADYQYVGDNASGALLWGFQINPGGPAPYNPALPPA